MSSKRLGKGINAIINPKTKKMLCLPRKEPENHMGANIISDFVSEQQKVVDFIRNEHERYIIL